MTTLHHTPEQLKAMLDAGNTMLRADMITEDAIALHEQLRWRKVEDELPEKPQPAGQCENYLISCRGNVFEARYTSAGLWLSVCGGCRYSPDAWMPLPSPPQENE